MSKKKPVQPPVAESFGLPLTGVDSHAHLDLSHFSTDLPAVLARARAAGVANIGNVFLSVEAWRRGRKLFVEYPEVFFLLGIHPTDAGAYTSSLGAQMAAAFAEDFRLRAVGEIGLDFYWKECPPDVQIPVFINQLGLARDLHMPVVIHSRDAFAETIGILKKEKFEGYPVLWHCFGGTAEQAKSVTDSGWHISIPGPVTFPSNADLRAALRVIPPDRLLAETDCPYLSPVPYRGKRNEPAYTVFTIAAMSLALDVALGELWTRCGDNARRFFGI